MAQAEARVHRIGQTRGVKTYWYVLEESSDEHVMRLVTRKGRIILDTLGDQSTRSRARLRSQTWRILHPDRVRQQKREWRWQQRRAQSNGNFPIADIVPTGPVRRGRPPKDPNLTPADKRTRARQRARAWNLAHRERVKEIKRTYR